MARGYFITFEGLDGSGKTTQMKRLESHLGRLFAGRVPSAAASVVTLRQPGGTALGDRVRSLLVDSTADQTLGPMTPMAELTLMFADRAQAVAHIIEPALAAGKVVLCDRFTDSSEAYQGAGRGLGTATVLAMHRLVCADLQPDLTLLLLPPLQTSLGRARRRNQQHLQQLGSDENRFEREPDAFYERIYQAYQAIARREPHRVVVMAGEASVDATEVAIASVVEARLAANVLQA